MRYLHRPRAGDQPAQHPTDTGGGPAPQRPRTGRRPAYLLALAAAAAALLTGAMLTVAIRPANAAPTLLSQGKPATASSTENAGTPASAAVDGNTGTRWSSAFSDPQWLQVDLGASATISQVAPAAIPTGQ